MRMNDTKVVLLPVLVASVAFLVLAGCNQTGEHPSSEHSATEEPASEHPASEHPAP